MSSIGCCGRQVSLQGLVAQADAYPARSPRGQRARARLAYTIVAGKAAQAGNRDVYQRAMAGLQGLERAELGSITSDLDAQLLAMGGSAQMRTVLGQIRGVAGLAGGIFGIIAAASNDSGVRLASRWLNFFLGNTLTPPVTDDAGLIAMADFCRSTGWATTLQDAVNAANLAIEGIAASAGTGSSTADALVGIVQGLTLALQFFTIFRTNVCASPAIAQGEAIRCATTTPNSGWNATRGACECLPGFTPQNCDVGGPGCDCLPAPPTPPPTPPGGGGPIQLTAEQRAAIYDARNGRPLTPRQQQLLVARPELFSSTAGTLDPVTRCAPGEFGNPCNGGVCDGPTGFYTAGMTCVNGVPTKPSSGAILPLAFGAGALFLLLK